MKNTLKIEQTNQVKKILILFLDLIVTSIIGVLLFFITFYPIYCNYSPYIEANDYIAQQREQYNLNEELNYDLSYTHYENYIKRMYEEHFEEILNYYYLQ